MNQKMFWEDTINGLVRAHEIWRSSCLNLCAAENVMSKQVRDMLGSDLAQRYGDYNGRDLTARKYFGTKIIVELEQKIEDLAKAVFGADFVELRPVSGHTAGNAIMMGLCKPGDTVLELSRECGGHRLASKLVTSELIPLHVEYHAFDDASFNLDVEGTLGQVDRLKPRLLIVGSSNFLFPIPLKELADGLKAYPDTVLVYDASHVLGLIVGKTFQDPLGEGAHVVLAGTQKSFPGPQGGVIYSNDGALMERISTAVYPALLSNHHLARLPALGLVLEEMRVSGREYAGSVVQNARELARGLHGEGLGVVGSDRGFTDSHTVLVQTGDLSGAEDWGSVLDRHDIIANTIQLPASLGGKGVRLGVSELTRRGAGVSVMNEIAKIVADVLLNRRNTAEIMTHVHELATRIRKTDPFAS
jgi:glycine hydroxymethyltransferase